MYIRLQQLKTTMAMKFIVWLVNLSFILSLSAPASFVSAQPSAPMPVPGEMVNVTESFTPALLRGIMIDPQEPFRFDFLIDTGESNFSSNELEEESIRLIKYFMASLTVPEDDLWVNLSPFEKQRIIPEQFGITEMGRDLLAQDYLLKQLTATLMYPEDELGKTFWDKVYKESMAKYGTTDIPVNTFNKVWIIPEEAVIYEQGTSAFIVKTHLKVMLEQDYVALDQNLSQRTEKSLSEHAEESEVNEIASEVIREILIPAIEEEVNKGEHFAALRQIYNSLILASWYKESIKQSLINQLYSDKNKVAGIDVEDKAIKEKIYQEYIKAFKEGVYNFIKEEYDPVSQELIPRKYFSGGVGLQLRAKKVITRTSNQSDFRLNGTGLRIESEALLDKNKGKESSSDEAILSATTRRVSDSFEIERVLDRWFDTETERTFNRSRWINGRGLQENSLVVMEEDGRIVGLASYRKGKVPSTQDEWLDSTYSIMDAYHLDYWEVDPGYRGKGGYGRLLLADVIAESFNDKSLNDRTRGAVIGQPANEQVLAVFNTLGFREIFRPDLEDYDSDERDDQRFYILDPTAAREQWQKAQNSKFTQGQQLDLFTDNQVLPEGRSESDFAILSSQQRELLDVMREKGVVPQEFVTDIISNSQLSELIAQSVLFNSGVLENDAAVDQFSFDVRATTVSQQEYLEQFKKISPQIINYARWLLENEDYKGKKFVVLGRAGDPIYDALVAFTHLDSSFQGRRNDVLTIDFSSSEVDSLNIDKAEYGEYLVADLLSKGVSPEFNDVVFVNEVASKVSLGQRLLNQFLGSDISYTAGVRWQDTSETVGTRYDGVTVSGEADLRWAKWLDVDYSSGREYTIQADPLDGVSLDYNQNEFAQRYINQRAMYEAVLRSTKADQARLSFEKQNQKYLEQSKFVVDLDKTTFEDNQGQSIAIDFAPFPGLPGMWILTLLDGETKAGTLIIQTPVSGNNARLHIDNVEVVPEYRRRGIYSNALKTLIASARSNGLYVDRISGLIENITTLEQVAEYINANMTVSDYSARDLEQARTAYEQLSESASNDERQRVTDRYSRVLRYYIYTNDVTIPQEFLNTTVLGSIRTDLGFGDLYIDRDSDRRIEIVGRFNSVLPETVVNPDIVTNEDQKIYSQSREDLYALPFSIKGLREWSEYSGRSSALNEARWESLRDIVDSSDFLSSQVEADTIVTVVGSNRETNNRIVATKGTKEAAVHLLALDKLKALQSSGDTQKRGEFLKLVVNQIERALGANQAQITTGDFAKLSWESFVPNGLNDNPAWINDADFELFNFETMGGADSNVVSRLRTFDRLIKSSGIDMTGLDRGLVIGFGQTSIELELVKNQFQLNTIDGVDWVSRRVLMAAKSLELKESSNDEYKLHHADARDLTGVFADGNQFDVIYAGAISVDNKSAPVEIAQEISRLLAPGGRVVIDEQNENFLNVLAENGLVQELSNYSYHVYSKPQTTPADLAILVNEDRLGKHIAVDVSVDSDSAIQLNFKEEALQFGLSRSTQEKIANVISRTDTQGVLQSGRSLKISLPEGEYINVNGQTLTSIRIKGVNNKGELPDVTQAYTGEDNLYNQPNAKLTVDDLGQFSVTPQENIPVGGFLLKHALDEYEMMSEAFSAGIPTAYPLGVGRFSSETMIFEGKSLGFVITAEETSQQERLADRIRERVTLKAGSNIGDMQEGQREFAQQVELVGQALRELHDQGFVHKNPHLRQFAQDADGNVLLYDFETAKSTNQLSKDEFLFWVVSDFYYLFYETNVFTYYSNPDVSSFYQLVNRVIGENTFPVEAFLKGYFSEAEAQNLDISQFRTQLASQNINDFYNSNLKPASLVARPVDSVLDSLSEKDQFVEVVIQIASQAYDIKQSSLESDNAILGTQQEKELLGQYQSLLESVGYTNVVDFVSNLTRTNPYTLIVEQLVRNGFDRGVVERAFADIKRGRQLKQPLNILRFVLNNGGQIGNVVDMRAVNSELLGVPYVGYDMGIKAEINAEDNPLVGVYGAAGVDVSNFLLSSNAREGFFISRDYSLEEKGRPKGRNSAEVYKDSKYTHGFTFTNEDQITALSYFDALLVELEAIGVSQEDLENINTQRDQFGRGDVSTINFKWGYLGQTPTDRTIHFVNSDMLDSEKLEAILPEEVDFYYQRAGVDLSTKYDQFLAGIAKRVKTEGFLVLDNYSNTDLRSRDVQRSDPNAALATVITTEAKTNFNMTFWQQFFPVPPLRLFSDYGAKLEVIQKTGNVDSARLSVIDSSEFKGAYGSYVNLLGNILKELQQRRAGDQVWFIFDNQEWDALPGRSMARDPQTGEFLIHLHTSEGNLSRGFMFRINPEAQDGESIFNKFWIEDQSSQGFIEDTKFIEEGFISQDFASQILRDASDVMRFDNGTPIMDRYAQMKGDFYPGMKEVIENNPTDAGFIVGSVRDSQQNEVLINIFRPSEAQSESGLVQRTFRGANNDSYDVNFNVAVDNSRLATPTGGIDLTPNNLNIEIQRDSNGVPVPFTPQQIEGINIEGLYPVIINITPIVNMPLLLGGIDQEPKPSDISIRPSLDPIKSQDRFDFSDPEQLSLLN